MVQMYFDRETDVDHRHKREEGFNERMPALRAAIKESTEARDPLRRAAFQHWTTDVCKRIGKLRPQSLKVPKELAAARGLDSQDVRVTEDNRFFGTIDGKECLLFPLPPSDE